MELLPEEAAWVFKRGEREREKRALRSQQSEFDKARQRVIKAKEIGGQPNGGWLGSRR